MTPEDEQAFLRTFAMYGPAGVIQKVGNHKRVFWTIYDGKPGFPLFKTKSEAIERVSGYVQAISEMLKDVP